MVPPDLASGPVQVVGGEMRPLVYVGGGGGPAR